MALPKSFRSLSSMPDSSIRGSREKTLPLPTDLITPACHPIERSRHQERFGIRGTLVNQTRMRHQKSGLRTEHVPEDAREAINDAE